MTRRPASATAEARTSRRQMAPERLISTCCGGRDVTPRVIAISALGDNCAGRCGIAEQRVTFKQLGRVASDVGVRRFCAKAGFAKACG